jgi:hypothetical protein
MFTCNRLDNINYKKNIFVPLYALSWSLGCVCFIKHDFWEVTFQIWAWFIEKCFLFILDWKYFLKIVKNLEISYYLLIISNLVLELLIAMYILFWIYFF